MAPQVLTAADSKRLFHPPPWMVGFVAKLPPGLRAVEPIELILLVGAMTVGVLVWAAASTVSRQKAALRKANAAGDEAALLQQARLAAAVALAVALALALAVALALALSLSRSLALSLSH